MKSKISNGKEMYLDNASTTCVAPEVWAAMAELYQKGVYGNASSVHRKGIEASLRIEQARQKIASRLGANPEEITFLSGGTEANNWVLKSHFEQDRLHGRPCRLIVSATEHPSVLATAAWLESQGAIVVRLKVNRAGIVDRKDFDRAIAQPASLISIHHANNETGALQPVLELAQAASSAGCPMHVDACQSFTKIPLNLSKIPLSFLTVSSHKIHGPKGIGALFARRGQSLRPLLHGGNQESGQRAGTFNLDGIVGFGVASTLMADSDLARMTELRSRLWDLLQQEIPGVQLNGPALATESLCSILNFAVPGVSAQSLARQLNQMQIYVSRGSACHASLVEPSHVLLAMGVSAELAMSSIRISISKFTRLEELEHFVGVLKQCLK